MHNPYISGPPIQDPSHFYGRCEAVSRIYAMLSGPQLQPLMLLGLRRAGKTSLLNYVTHPRVMATRLHRPEDHVLAYVNLEADVRTPADFYRLLTRRILEATKQLPSMYPAVMAAHGAETHSLSMVERLIETINRRMTVLLDEFETLTSGAAFGTEFFNGLRSLVARYPFTWITASYRNLYDLGSAINVESSPFFNVFNQSIYVGAMTSEEVQELVILPARHAGRPFRHDDANWIEQVAGGLPCFVQKLAELLFDAREAMPENQVAARESAARAFAQWAVYHFNHYWKHFTDDEHEVLAKIASERQADWAAHRSEHGTDALDALIGYGLVVETGQGYQLHGSAFQRWISAQTRPLRTTLVAAPTAERPHSTSNRGGSRMLEAAQVSILAKAVDFIFEQGRLILQERRERRKAMATTPAQDSDFGPDEPVLSTKLSKTEALRTPIRIATWSVREAEVKHLVSLLEIQARNYWLAKEQYARWGSAMVPPVVVSNLEEAENSVSETTERLHAILSELYQEKAEPATA
jgi:hypothetical protein